MAVQQGPMSALPGQVTIDTASSIGDFRDLFQQASDRGDRLQTELVRINTEMHNSVNNLQAELAQARVETAKAQADAQTAAMGRQMDRFDLIDMKAIAPTHFDGNKLESFRPWGKRLKAFCNAKKSGFREALETSEKAQQIISPR